MKYHDTRCSVGGARAFLEELGSLLGWAPTRGVFVLTAYIDDSNIHNRRTGRAEIVGHGGAVATFEQWKNLEREWRSALNAEGIDTFHMTDFEKYQQAFKEWGLDRHRRFLVGLLNIIKRNVTAYIGYSVPASFGKAFIKTHLSSIGRMLYYCSQEAGKSDNGKISLVFAKHPEISSTRIGQFVSAINRSMPELHSFTGASPEDCCCLQAADLLAYEFVRWREAPWVSDSTRYPLRHLFADAIQTFHVFHS